eukprot:Rhum_TRINITY_DN15326_c0_g1::Rhum_TRINITY_DN15326_c0_g1_i1::g.151839::m.151839
MDTRHVLCAVLACLLSGSADGRSTYFDYSAVVERAKAVLSEMRQPVQLTEQEPHTWGNKYEAVESMSAAAVAGVHNAFLALGLADDGLSAKLTELQGVASQLGGTVTLEYTTKATTTLVDTREKRTGNKKVVKSTGVILTTTTEVYDMVTEYTWERRTESALTLYAGFPGKDVPHVDLARGHATVKLYTRTADVPNKEIGPLRRKFIDIGWLFQRVEAKFRYSIDRSKQTCRTPANNEETIRLRKQFHNLLEWAQAVASLTNNEVPQQGKWPARLSAFARTLTEVFVPVAPLLGSVSDCDSAGPCDARQMPASDINVLLAEQRRTLQRALSDGTAELPELPEAMLRVRALVQHLRVLCQQFDAGVLYVKDLVLQQLVSAIGREVTKDDFKQFMRQHQQAFFAEGDTAPAAFSRAVRRPGHVPEGTLLIEETDDAGRSAPIATQSRLVPDTALRLALSSSASLALSGPHRLHSFVDYTFGSTAGRAFTLRAEAREFASFALVLAKLGTAGQLAAEEVLIVQNKETLRIPLMLEALPTPKAFKRAISSLSPEQQRFAKTYRSLQLQGTLFVVATVELKPLMERVLNLPPNSLSKEIKLTHSLIELFVTHDISSEMLCYDADVDGEAGTTREKVAHVKQHAADITAFIDDVKAKALAEKPDPKDQVKEGRGRRRKMRSAMHPDVGVYSAEGHDPPTSASMMRPLDDGDAGGSVLLGDAAESEEVYAEAAPSGRPMPDEKTEVHAKQANHEQADKRAEKAQGEAAPQRKEKDGEKQAVERQGGGVGVFETFPTRLEEAMSTHDLSDALRPTIITPGPLWERRSRKSLIDDFETRVLPAEERRSEHVRALSLLDALTKSGALDAPYSEVHVVVPTTHHFERVLMATLAHDNVNPIEAIESSMIIVATTLYNTTAQELVSAGAMAKREGRPPHLIKEDSS